jgi:hypothetical protein
VGDKEDLEWQRQVSALTALTGEIEFTRPLWENIGSLGNVLIRQCL